MAVWLTYLCPSWKHGGWVLAVLDPIKEEACCGPAGGLHALMGHMLLHGPSGPCLRLALSSHRQKIAALSRH